jgi:hypothetical protein
MHEEFRAAFPGVIISEGIRPGLAGLDLVVLPFVDNILREVVPQIRLCWNGATSKNTLVMAYGLRGRVCILLSASEMKSHLRKKRWAGRLVAIATRLHVVGFLHRLARLWVAA